VSRDAATFSSEASGTQIRELPRQDPRVSPDLLANMDPPRHTRYRAIIGQSFTPTSISRMADFVRGQVTRLLDELTERDEFEFMEQFAGHIPMETILKMVGVPSDDKDQLQTWIMQILAQDDPEYQSSNEDIVATTGRFMAYASDLAKDRRSTPRDDLLSRLMSAEVEGQKLTYDEFGMFFILLLAAGTHTTHLSLGNGIATLLQYPEQRRLLIADPSLCGKAFEEVLRFCPPIMHFRRTATRSTEIAGSRIEAGQKVVVWYVSANRDETVFSDPDPNVFEVRRSSDEHVAFGYGPHFCLGNALARLTGKIALEECLRRMPDMQLAGPPERLRSNWFNGFKRLRLAPG
jgi:cytochrome P450